MIHSLKLILRLLQFGEKLMISRKFYSRCDRPLRHIDKRFDIFPCRSSPVVAHSENLQHDIYIIFTAKLRNTLDHIGSDHRVIPALIPAYKYAFSRRRPPVIYEMPVIPPAMVVISDTALIEYFRNRHTVPESIRFKIQLQRVTFKSEFLFKIILGIKDMSCKTLAAGHIFVRFYPSGSSNLPSSLRNELSYLLKHLRSILFNYPVC